MWVNYPFGVAQSVGDQVPGHFQQGTEPQMLMRPWMSTLPSSICSWDRYDPKRKKEVKKKLD